MVWQVTPLSSEERLDAQSTALIADDRTSMRYEATVVALEKRQQELLATIARLSKEAIDEDEAAEMRGQMATLMAEVGTQKARVAELEGELDEWRSACGLNKGSGPSDLKPGDLARFMADIDLVCQGVRDVDWLCSEWPWERR